MISSKQANEAFAGLGVRASPGSDASASMLKAIAAIVKRIESIEATQRETAAAQLQVLLTGKAAMLQPDHSADREHSQAVSDAIVVFKRASKAGP